MSFCMHLRVHWISHLGGPEKFSESVIWPHLFINLARFTGLKKSQNFYSSLALYLIE